MTEREEAIHELTTLLQELEGKSKANDDQLRRMFNLNNYFYPQLLEYGKHCPSCVQRVYKRLINYKNSL